MPLFTRVYLKINYWNNEIAYLLWQSYEYVFPLTIVLLLTAVVLHSDHFVP